MKHWELEHAGELIRIEWNEAATFNLQTPIGGQWVDYHCFTCYGIETDQEALEHAFEVLAQLFPEGCNPDSIFAELEPQPEPAPEPYLQQPNETRTEYCTRIGIAPHT